MLYVLFEAIQGDSNEYTKHIIILDKTEKVFLNYPQ